MFEQLTAHVQSSRRPVRLRSPRPNSSPLGYRSPRACSLSQRDDYRRSRRRHRHRRLTPDSQVFVGPVSGNENPTNGMPAPSLPFLLCETEQHPKPNLSYLSRPFYSLLLCETEQHPKPNLASWLFVMGPDLIASVYMNDAY